LISCSVTAISKEGKASIRTLFISSTLCASLLTHTSRKNLALPLQTDVSCARWVSLFGITCGFGFFESTNSSSLLFAHSVKTAHAGLDQRVHRRGQLGRGPLRKCVRPHHRPYRAAAVLPPPPNLRGRSQARFASLQPPSRPRRRPKSRRAAAGHCSGARQRQPVGQLRLRCRRGGRRQRRRRHPRRTPAAPRLRVRHRDRRRRCRLAARREKRERASRKVLEDEGTRMAAQRPIAPSLPVTCLSVSDPWLALSPTPSPPHLAYTGPNPPSLRALHSPPSRYLRSCRSIPRPVHPVARAGRPAAAACR
jgi:hypothetical protein